MRSTVSAVGRCAGYSAGGDAAFVGFSALKERIVQRDGGYTLAALAKFFSNVLTIVFPLSPLSSSAACAGVIARVTGGPPVKDSFFTRWDAVAL
jgi:hypothetical protein